MSMAAYEAGPEVSPFSSKFDYALANPTKSVLTKDELAGWNLFRGQGRCNTCHSDGTENIKKGKITPADAAYLAPLFTDFTSANTGTPQNFALPFLYEDKQDQFGYVANALGLSYIDLGVGSFLTNIGFAKIIGQPSGPGIGTGHNPNPDWAALAPQFYGKIQVPTLRNVDMRPRRDFVKAYMHNGYFKTLKAVVHFYNTRDKLNGGVHKPAGQAGEGILYWPTPEVNVNVDKTIGNLGLSAREEEQIVLFMQTLTDGWPVPERDTKVKEAPNPKGQQGVQTTATAATAHTLTVHKGRSRGQPVAGEVVTVTADPPPPGQKFAGWSCDTEILANPSERTTTATMLSIDVTITATYASE
jgi:cytochrome c peroxidase